MGTDTNHNSTGDQVGGRHVSVLFIEIVVDDKTEEPGHATGNVE